MNHKLALEAIETLNTKYLRIMDMSKYDENIPVTCQLLEITVPGFKSPVQFNSEVIDPGFILNISACDLNLQKLNCDTNPLDLPDGIYILKYSVSPRDTVYVEYNHLRTSCLMNRYKKILCSIPLDGSEPDDETKEKLNQLHMAYMYIMAAKSKVEICHEPQKGMILYEYAKKILSNFDCINC